MCLLSLLISFMHLLNKSLDFFKKKKKILLTPNFGTVEYVYQAIFFLGTVAWSPQCRQTHTPIRSTPMATAPNKPPFFQHFNSLHFIFSTLIKYRFYLHFVRFQCVIVRCPFYATKMYFLAVDHNIKPSEFLFTPRKPQDKMGFDEVREQNLWNVSLDRTLMIDILQRNLSWFKLLWSDIFLFCPALFLRLSHSFFCSDLTD